MDTAASHDGTVVYSSGGLEGIPGTYFVAAMDAFTGVVLWKSHLHQQAGGAVILEASQAGDAIFTANAVWTAQGSDIEIRAHSPQDGTVLWVATYDGPTMDRDWPWDLVLSPDGTALFVIGQTGAIDSSNYLTGAFSTSSGALLWERTYGGAGPDYALAGAVSGEGSYLHVTGKAMERPPLITNRIPAIVTVTYDATSGETVWIAKRQTGSSGTYLPSIPMDVAVSTSQGAVVVTGCQLAGDGLLSPVLTPVGLDVSYLTIAYDMISGRRLWQNEFGIPGQNCGLVVAVAKDGETAYVGGIIQGLPPHISYTLTPVHLASDFGTMAYDVASGDLKWLAIYSGLPDGDEFLKGLLVSERTGEVIVGGYSAHMPFTADALLVSYDAENGLQRWVRRYPDAYGVAVAIDPNMDRVFLSGTTADEVFSLSYLI